MRKSISFLFLILCALFSSGPYAYACFEGGDRISAEEYIQASDIIFIGQKVSKTSIPTEYESYVKNRYKILEVLKGDLKIGQILEFVQPVKYYPVYPDKGFPQQELIILIRPKNAKGESQKDSPYYQRHHISGDMCDVYEFSYEDLVNKLRKK